MRQYYTRLAYLLLGLFLYALGIVFTLKANIGYAPWEVFHVGLASTVGISIGAASVLTGLVIVAAVFILGEKLGLGTILNMILIGVNVDLIMLMNIVPKAANAVLGTAMLILGLFIISLGSYFYIGSGFGAGPRDSLMVALTRKTTLSIGICRGMVEASALAVGWVLGGMVGIGTIISVFAIGACVQITFKGLKFDAAAVKHETIEQSLKKLLRKETEQSDNEAANTDET